MVASTNVVLNALAKAMDKAASREGLVDGLTFKSLSVAHRSVFVVSE